MRFLKPVSHHIVIAYGIVLGMVAVLGLCVSDGVSRGPSRAEGDNRQWQIRVVQRRRPEGQGSRWSRVTCGTEREWKVAEDTKVVSHIRGVAKEGTAREAFKPWEPGAVIAVKVKDGKVTFVEIGSKHGGRQAPEKRRKAPIRRRTR